MLKGAPSPKNRRNLLRQAVFPLLISACEDNQKTWGYCWPTLILVLNNLKKALKGNDHEGHLSQGDVLEARVFGLGLTRGFFPQLTTKSISVVKNT
jgi:hypothetical protein